MKRKIAIASIAAAVLIGGGTASAVAFTDGGDSGTSGTRVTDDRAGRVGDDAAADGSKDGAKAEVRGGGEDRAADGAGDDRPERGDTDGLADDLKRWRGDTDGWDDDRDDDRRDQGDRGDDAEDRTLRGATLSVGAAIDAALRARPGTVVSIDLDAEAGRAVWDVDVLGRDGHWYDLELDAGNGKVLRDHRAHEDDAAELKRALKATTVSATDAIREALRTTQGVVISVDLDDGLPTGWDVDVLGKDGKDRELRVDLSSGKVTWHADDDHDDD